MQDLISIVIPVYNVEKYFEKCISSILNQTYKNLEIILVNDGSTDNSGALCDDYAKKDSRIKVYHKENSGAAKAREYGVEKATGKYLCFVDSDDYIELDFCSVMYSELIDKQADWVGCNYRKVGFPDNEPIKAIETSSVITDKKQLFSDYIESKAYTFIIWGKLYKIELLKGYKFKDFVVGEDTCCAIDIFNKTQKAALINYIGYNYYCNEKSLSHRTDYLKYRDKAATVEYCVEVILKSYPQYSERCETLQNSALLARYFSAVLAPKNHDSKQQYKKIIRIIKNKDIKTITASATVKKHFFLIKYFSCVYKNIIKHKL